MNIGVILRERHWPRPRRAGPSIYWRGRFARSAILATGAPPPTLQEGPRCTSLPPGSASGARRSPSASARSCPTSEANRLLRYLVGHCGLRGAAVLSTCNRTEFYVSCPTEALADEVRPRLAMYLDPVDDSAVGDHLFELRDAEAIRHMLRVAGGLESMVVGEAQVLGQMRERTMGGPRRRYARRPPRLRDAPCGVGGQAGAHRDVDREALRIDR